MGTNRNLGNILSSLGVLLVAGEALADEPSAWSDSERLGDLVFFGAYAGVTVASARDVTHRSDLDGTAATLRDLGGSPSFAGGYQVTWSPYDFMSLDATIEGFGLPFDPPARFDDASGPTPTPRTPVYGGGGFQVSPVLRAGIPLHFMQPSIGVGLMHPVLFQSTLDPVSRVDEVHMDVGLGARAVGGVQVYVSRTFRVFADYHLDYHFPFSVASSDSLEMKHLLRHAAVVGFLHSPDSYRDPNADKLSQIIPPFLVPIVFYALFPIALAANEE